MEDEYFSKVKNCFAKVFGVADEPNDLVRGCGKWDSLKHMALISEIEAELQITLTMQQILEIKSFDTATKVVRDFV